MSGARFTVTRSGSEEQPITDATGGYGSMPQGGIQFAPHSGDACKIEDTKKIEDVQEGKDYAVVYGGKTFRVSFSGKMSEYVRDTASPVSSCC